jgi:transposase
MYTIHFWHGKFEKVCAMLAAKHCYLSGTSVKEIAKQANKSPSTIYKWLKITKTKLNPNNYH